MFIVCDFNSLFRWFVFEGEEKISEREIKSAVDVDFERTVEDLVAYILRFINVCLFRRTTMNFRGQGFQSTVKGTLEHFNEDAAFQYCFADS